MIKLECQICHQEMSVPDSMVGQFEACPTCKTIVAVPGRYKPNMPAGWYEDRAASANAERLRQAQASARKLIWGFALAALCFVVLGLIVVSITPYNTAIGLFWITTVCAGLCAAIAFAAMPGAIARSRGLANADGLNTLGVLGVFIPIIWLVALVMALVGTPATQTGRNEQ